MTDGHVQRPKAAVRRHQTALNELIGALTMTTAEQGWQVAVLGDAAGNFVAIRPDLAPQLLEAAYDDKRQWLEPTLHVRVPEVRASAIKAPEMNVLAPRVRPSPRPS